MSNPSTEPNPYEPPERAGRTNAVEPLPSSQMGEGRGDRLSVNDLFGVVVRGYGLYLLINGLQQGIGAYFPGPEYVSSDYIPFAALHLVCGGFLFLGAGVVVDWAYSPNNRG